MEIKTIGRGSDNDLQIEKPDISTHHVRISRTDVNCFLVEDLGSANHTFVNGYPIRKATVSITDELRLSKDTMIDLRTLFRIQSIPNGQQTAESQKYTPGFWELKEVYEKNRLQRREINKKHQYKTNFTRTGVMILCTGIAFLILWPDKLTYLFAVSIVSGGVAGFFTPASPTEKHQALNEDFYRRFRCPECKKPLGYQFTWNHWAQEGACPHCKTGFLKNN